MKRLSLHLSLAEFLATQHRDLVAEQERAWLVDPALQARAVRFAQKVFEPVRMLVGPLHVNSGFRCPALNAAVRGQRASRHLLGVAADVTPVEVSVGDAMATVARALATGALPDLDEIILEYGRWLHIQGCFAAVGRPRQVALMTFDGTGYEPFDAKDPRVDKREVLT